jgi:hypothetical protein
MNVYKLSFCLCISPFYERNIDICVLLEARFHWKQSVKVVFIFSSKTRVLVWCGLKQAEYEPNTTHVSEQCLSLAEYPRIWKRSFSAGFQTENNLFKNPSNG